MLASACGGSSSGASGGTVTRPEEATRLATYAEIFDREPGVYDWPVHIVGAQGCAPCEGPHPCEPCGPSGIEVVETAPQPDGAVGPRTFIDAAGWGIDAFRIGGGCRIYVRLQRIEGRPDPYLSLASSACDPR